MRDVKFNKSNVAVGGDFILTDTQNTFKTIQELSYEELKLEEGYRRKLLRKERIDKAKKTLFIGVALSACFILFWFARPEYREFLDSFIAALGAIVGLLGLKFYLEPTEFESRQLEILKEIGHLRKERE